MRFSSCPSGLRQPLIARIYIPQNEKRKDKEVTARIERIFQLRDQAMKGVDTGAHPMFILCALAGDEYLSLRQSGTKGRSSRAHPQLCDHPVSVALSVTSAS
jgi:hypothetical protein